MTWAQETDMRKDEIWIATVPNDDSETPTSDAYQAHEAAGDILHVVSDPEATFILTRTETAARTASEQAEAHSGPVVISVRRGLVWTADPGDDDDLTELQYLETRMAVHAITPVCVFTFLDDAPPTQST